MDVILGSKTRCRKLLYKDPECGIRDMRVLHVADVLDGSKGPAINPIESCSQGLADRP